MNIASTLAHHVISQALRSKWEHLLCLASKITAAASCQIRVQENDTIELTVVSNLQDLGYHAGERFLLPSLPFCAAVLSSRSEQSFEADVADGDREENFDINCGMQSYFGVPLEWPNGRLFGTLCILRSKTAFTVAQQEMLHDIKTVVEHDLKVQLQYRREFADVQALWNAIQSATSESVIVIDTNGNFLSSNQTGAERFGLSPEEIIGKNVFDLVPANVGKARRKMISQVIQSKKSMRFQDCRNDRIYDFIVYPVLDALGLVTKLVVFATDITNQMNVRLALENSERKYRELVDDAATIILRWDPLGNITFFNEYAQKFFDFPEDEIVGKNVVGTIVPATESSGRDLATLMEEICADPAKFESNENENIKRNGERVWIAWKNKPIFNRQGELVEIHSVGIDISDRKNAEDALRESEARWRTLTENSPEHVMLVDRNGIILFINYTVPDLTKEQVIGQKMVNFLPPGYVESTQEVLDRVWETGEPGAYTVEYHSAEGDVSYFEANVGPVVGEEGVTALIVSARNITEHKIVQEALRTSEEKMRLLLNQADFILWSVDSDLNFTSSLGGGLFQFGYTANQAVEQGLNLAQVLAADPNKEMPLRAHYRALKGKSESYEIEWEGRHFQAQVSPQKDDSGKIIGCVGVAVDITDLKRAQEALHESELRQKRAQKVGRVGTWDWNPQTGDLVWSDETYRIMGYVPHEVTPSYELFLEHVNDDDRPMLHTAVQAAINDRKPYSLDCRIWTKQGEEVIAHAQGEVRFNNEGVPLQMIGTFQDITDRKRIEKELEKYKNHLEELVETRTCELITSNRELESYSYSIAHDLRSPLRSITGFSQILREEAMDKLGEDQIDTLNRIVGAGMKMSSLIDDILELSRITRSEISMGEVDLTAMSWKLLTDIKQAYPQRQIDFQVEENLFLNADSRLLEVALQNLLDNAFKYSRNKPCSQIYVGRNYLDGQDVYYVMDNGVGFNMEYAGQLFQPFRRLHLPEEFEGSGVGLATVQRIIHRHGGRVWADSKEGEGTTFYFTIRDKSPSSADAQPKKMH